MDVQWPHQMSEAKNQTAWPVFVVGIVFDDFTITNRFAQLLYANVTQDAFVNRMLRELNLTSRNLFSD